MKKSNALTLAVSLLISFLILEFGLQLLTPYPVRDPSSRIDHEWLVYVMNPDMDEIDEAGFRNKALSSVDVVAIGDSHTYGFNVLSEDSWPKVLGRELGKNIYNFGMGGYGVLHYKYLMDRAVELNPEEIILALYLANDLNDVCRHASILSMWASREEKTGLDVSACPAVEKQKKKVKNEFRLKDKSAIASMLSEFNDSRKIWTKIYLTGTDGGVVVNDDHIKSLISLKRIKAQERYMDISRPEITMAFEVLKIFLEDASQKAKNKGIGFSVLLIPSKEMVFYRYLNENNYILPDEYTSLVRNEDGLRKAIMLLLEENQIRYGDVLPALQQALMDNSDVYPVNDDGHPLKKGYEVYAGVAEKIMVYAAN